MAKAFSTDYDKELPWGRREPYRLWFEYLKLALNAEEYKTLVNRKFYAAWGDVANERFEGWWEKNWRQLFAVPANIEVLRSAADVTAERSSVVVKLRRGDSIKNQLNDLKQLIETLEKPSKTAKPLYTITASHSMTDKSLRAMLRLGELFRKTGSLEDAAEQYLDRAQAWNAKIKKWNATKPKQNQKRNEMFIPAELECFAEEIKALREERQRQQRKVKQSDGYRQYRVGTQRLLKKFDAVVRNVAEGQFPGKY